MLQEISAIPILQATVKTGQQSATHRASPTYINNKRENEKAPEKKKVTNEGKRKRVQSYKKGTRLNFQNSFSTDDNRSIVLQDTDDNKNPILMKVNASCA